MLLTFSQSNTQKISISHFDHVKFDKNVVDRITKLCVGGYAVLSTSWARLLGFEKTKELLEKSGLNVNYHSDPVINFLPKDCQIF